jgi:hypothetical protein
MSSSAATALSAPADSRAIRNVLLGGFCAGLVDFN